MLVVVPFITLGLMTAALARRLGWRDGILLGFTSLALLWWSTATVLSRFEAFALPGILLHYAAASAVSLAALARWGLPSPPRLGTAVRNPWIVALVVTYLALLLIAVSVAPNNFDSLGYHLPKMEQWIQMEAVRPFRTQFLPQIYLPPLAEVGLAHMSILSGTLWALNLVQLLASLVTMVGASVIARNLGLDVRGQSIAAGLIGLAPIAVSEAVTTQNDAVAAALVVVVYAVASRTARSVHPGWVLVAALAAGLALCTKPTGALVALPACVWALVHLRGVGWGRALGIAVAGVGVAGVLNAGWMLDNQRIFGSPLGPEVTSIGETDAAGLTTTEHSLGITVGNAVRNGGSVLATPRNEDVNQWIRDGLAAGMSAIGIDPDDPDALHGADRWVVDNRMTEDQTGSPAQLLLILGALGLCVAAASVRRRAWPLVACLLVGYAMFCALLRWQPFGTRLLLPALAVGCVLAAFWVVRWRPWAQLALLAVLVVQAFPLVAQQPHRPLIGGDSVLVTDEREELFRPLFPGVQPIYEDFSTYLTREPGTHVGLMDDMANWEYPMWHLLKEADPTVKIGYVDGVGPGRRRAYWDVTLAYNEMMTHPRPEDWAAAGLGTP